MKRLKAILMILSTVLIVGAVVIGSANAQSETNQTNYLKVQGKILADYTADIQVWEYQPGDETWVKVYDKSNKTKYSIRLNPQLNYQIRFTSNEGHMKVMHVDAGVEGPWYMKLNINFNQYKLNYAKMYQNTDKTHYLFTSVDRYYVNTTKMMQVTDLNNITANKTVQQ
jgi:hypothetical protein